MFEYCILGPSQLDEVLAFEAEILSGLERPDLLRRNTKEMWQTCLSPPHTALGARIGERLVALAVLYLPVQGGEEDLVSRLSGVHTEGLKSANYKICMVLPDFRGRGLQRILGEKLEREATVQGICLLCSTASPYNEASIVNLRRLGYQYSCTLSKYGFVRNLYYKTLPR